MVVGSVIVSVMGGNDSFNLCVRRHCCLCDLSGFDRDACRGFHTSGEIAKGREAERKGW